MTASSGKLSVPIIPLVFFLLIVLSSCAHSKARQQDAANPAPGENEIGQEPAEEVSVSDPLEPWNRLMFKFNDKLYYKVMKPFTKGYNKIFSEEVRTSINNFFSNLATPIRFVNSALQGKIKSAGNELVRLGMNSTVGLAGLFDPAKSQFKIEKKDEDLGQTLGFFGLGEGFYIVWPFLGPSSLRDTAGLVGDGFLYPPNYISDTKAALAIDSYQYVNENSLRIEEYEDLTKTAIEPYVALKEAYIQYRRSLIKNGSDRAPEELPGDNSYPNRSELNSGWAKSFPSSMYLIAR